MHFRSAERGVFSEYPVQPYSNTMYAGVLDEALVLLKGAGSEGFYADSGGYGWYYNGDTNKSIDMVFAPGGGQRITYYVTDANYQTIFDKVVKGKKPATKDERQIGRILFFGGLVAGEQGHGGGRGNARPCSERRVEVLGAVVVSPDGRRAYGRCGARHRVLAVSEGEASPLEPSEDALGGSENEVRKRPLPRVALGH
jgi:hypothetical protein